MEKKKAVIKEIISWVIVLVLAFVIGNCLNKFVLMKAEIPSGSMENTMQIGDRVFGFRLAYLFSEPKRGDIVMFDYPDDESILYVKRIIGLPGEVVEIVEGKVYINGSTTPLEEDYLKEEPVGSYGKFQVPEGCYFMLGDNRNNSWDSRKWKNKYVAEDKIKCKVLFRYKPGFQWLD
ncbi:MAG: signal peptidase I [Lachnospiraceae bacterium]